MSNAIAIIVSAAIIVYVLAPDWLWPWLASLSPLEIVVYAAIIAVLLSIIAFPLLGLVRLIEAIVKREP